MATPRQVRLLSPFSRLLDPGGGPFDNEMMIVVVIIVIVVVIVNNEVADQEAAWSHHLPPPFPQFCLLRRNLPPFHKFTAKVDSKVFLNFWNCICQLCARLATTQL